MWPTILIGAAVGAVLHLAIYAVTKSLRNEPMTWKGALAAGLGGAVGGALAGSGVGLLAGGGARALSFVATNGAVAAGTETATRNALEGQPLLKDVVHDAAVGAATAPLFYGAFRSASRLLPEVRGALDGKVPVDTVIADVKDALAKVRAGDAAGLVGGDAGTFAAATGEVAASGRAGALALIRDRIGSLLTGAARTATPALRDPAHHLISASSLTDVVGPAVVLAGDVLDPSARRRREDLPRPRDMDTGLPLPRTPDRRSPPSGTTSDTRATPAPSGVTIDVAGSGTTVTLGSSAPAGTTVTVGPDGRTVTVRVGAAGAGAVAPGPRATGLVGALGGGQRRVAR